MRASLTRSIGFRYPLLDMGGDVIDVVNKLDALKVAARGDKAQWRMIGVRGYDATA